MEDSTRRACRQPAHRPRRGLVSGDEGWLVIRQGRAREIQLDAAGAAGGAGGLGSANCESSMGILISILVVTICWDWLPSTAPDSTRYGYLRPSTSPEIAEEVLPRNIHNFTGDAILHLARAFPFVDEAGGGVKVKIAGIALLAGELEFLNGLAIHYFLADILNLIALGFVIHERTIQIAFFRNTKKIRFAHSLDNRVGDEGVSIQPADLPL